MVTRLPQLKYRKAVYLLLAVPSVIMWFPLVVITLVAVVGAFGLAGIVGLRSIVLLPIKDSKTRRIYTLLLSLGIVPLMPVVFAFTLDGICAKEGVFCLLQISGLALLIVSACLLCEIHLCGAPDASQETEGKKGT